jgi:peptide/nickel transport system substrate-binding protein
MKKLGKRGIEFTFGKDANWEIPLIVGLMPILSKEHWSKYLFGKSRTKKPLGSGAYIVKKVALGEKIVYQRNKNYWGRNLAVNRGRFNFDRLQIDYYRDDSTRFEAFKAGKFDFLEEHSPTRWAKAYDFTAVKEGEIVKKQFSLKTPAPMWSIVFNTRKDKFKDKIVRRALQLTFDGAWVNKNLFFDLWKENYSFWARSKLESRPCCPKNLPLRQRKRQALKLFRAAGWQIENNQLIKDGEKFTFTILVKSRLNERIALVWKQQLKQFGIRAAIRFIDDSQFERRKQNYTYDIIFARWYLSLSPGNEQDYYWGSRAAKTKSSRNYAGIASPQIDRQITKITNAQTQEQLSNAVKTLDRLLLDGHYMIPLFFADKQWIAMHKTIQVPQTRNFYGYRIENWWR